MKIKNDSGFSAIEMVIVLAVVVLLGLVGWRVVASRDKKDSSKTPVTPTTPTTPTPASKSDSATDGSTKYLEIKEWGIKFALTAKTADAYYDTKTNSPLASMSLRSHSLDAEPKCKNDPQSVATIFRVAKDAVDPSTGKKYNVTQGGRTVGDYFYFIQGAQAYCTDNMEAQTTLQGVLIGFNTAGPSIRKL